MKISGLFQGVIGVLVAPLCLFGLLSIGCGGSSSVDDNVKPVMPRPPYGGVNITLETGGETSSRQLFLDYGTTQFPKVYPILVGNHQDNQAVTLWRYDFKEPNAATPETALYATLIVRVDDGASGFASFWGRGGTWPVGAHVLNPATAFPGDVPETPQNKVQTACFFFLRQGAPCRIVDPSLIGRVNAYRTLSDKTTVAVHVPGLDFPVGGATLATSGSTVVTSEVGNAGRVTDLQVDENGVPLDGITNPIQTVDIERVPTVDRVSPVTSEWDLCFAWQPTSLGVTFTHSFTADPTVVGGLYSTGQFAATGGGFFVTMLPGAPNVPDGVNTLNWTFLRSTQDAVWALGWTSDLAATGSVSLGNGAGSFSEVAPGSAVVTVQARAFLAGVMHPDAKATIFQSEQDKAFAKGPSLLLEGTRVPLVARSRRATLPGQLAQLTVGGRTLWYRQNSTILGADVLNGDQTLTNRYGTMISFSSYLPVRN